LVNPIVFRLRSNGQEGVMSKLFATIGILLTITAGPMASATTWGKSTVKDPVSGDGVEVQEPMSSGSYIYEWPGKEDQVFWPATDEHWQLIAEREALAE
jgi:hypothetical protein